MRYRLVMAKRLAKVVGWLVGSILGLGLLAYCVLFIVNLLDQPRSPVIDTLLAARPDTPAANSDSNSYLFMLGFSGPPDTDPMALGRERHEWLLSARPDFNPEDDPLSDEYSFRRLRSDAIAELSRTCSESEVKCLQLLNSGEETVIQWLADEGWLLDRYNALIRMSAFREAVPFEILAPLPTYGVMFEGQRLLIADAWLAARAGEAESVSAQLEHDLTFWRMVLEDSDVLITKMIATAAIIRHFKLGNLVLRSLPESAMSAGIPASWREEISPGERSMKRSSAGEWRFFDESTRKAVADPENPFGDWTGLTDSTTWTRVAWVMLKPFWQTQDVSNRQARLMLDLANAFEVPYERVPTAVEIADKLNESAYSRFSRLYNLTGDIVMSMNYWKFSHFAVRVSDLEGIRRAAVLVAGLRAQGVTKDEVVRHMLVSEIVDPYTNEPFSWHDSSDVVVFQGLEPHDRSEHKIIY